MKAETRRRIVIIVTIIALQSLSLVPVGLCQPRTISHYFAGPNHVLAIDYLDGTLAVGTEQGLFVSRNGEIQFYNMSDGLLRTIFVTLFSLMPKLSS